VDLAAGSPLSHLYGDRDRLAVNSVHHQAVRDLADGFVVEGGSKSVVLSGGLQTSALSLGENRLKIAPDERLTADALPPAPGPAAAEPVLFILSIRPLAWTERQP
jgi:hypothetical protein